MSTRIGQGQNYGREMSPLPEEPYAEPVVRQYDPQSERLPLPDDPDIVRDLNISHDNSLVNSRVINLAPAFDATSRRFGHIKIVVNVPIQFKDTQQAWESIRSALNMLEGIDSSDFPFFVVFGLNRSSNGNQGSSVEQDAEQLNVRLAKEEWKNVKSVSVVGYAWKPAKGETNFVEIRNKLLYSDQTKKAIGEAIDGAQKLSNSTVRLLFLDPDTEITKEALKKLVDHWQKKEAAVITGGFYGYNISSQKIYCRSWN